MAMTTSHPSASSAGDANAFAPASTRGFVFAVSRFQTLTSCPTDINRCAIDDPIRPVPHTPIFIFYLKGGLFSLMGVKDAKILRDQRFIVEDFAGVAREHATSGVEDDRLIRHLEGQFPVLLDQDDGLPLLLQPLDGAADLGDDQGGKALRRFVEQQYP